MYVMMTICRAQSNAPSTAADHVQDVIGSVFKC